MERYKKIKTNAQGSLTLEAAFVLPVFIYAILAFIYFLQIIHVQEEIQHALSEIGMESVRYAYVYDYIKNYDNTSKKEQDTAKQISKLSDKQESQNIKTESKSWEVEEKVSSKEAAIAKIIDSIYFKNRIGEHINKNFINSSCIKGGMGGISTYLSNFMKENDTIDIIVTYRIKFSVLFFNLGEIQFLQRVHMRGFTGYNPEPETEKKPEEETKEKIVYITKTGTVYHTKKNCTHLKLSIRKVSMEEMNELRNASGGKYKECFLCKADKGKGQSYAYITDTGDSYHWKLECSGLKRTVIEIPISEVGGRTKCKRCND